MNTIKIIFLIVVLCSCNGQKNIDIGKNSNDLLEESNSNQNLLTILKDIEEINRVGDRIVSLQGEELDYDVELKKVASTEQLIGLTNHKNPAVRCYAFKALSKNHSDIVFQVLLNHLNDTLNVHVVNGCIGKNQKVSEFFIETVSNKTETDMYKLDKTERKTLDSILNSKSNPIKNQ
jgi:hypothetical protein